jgi:tight adherence protein B
LALQTPLLIYGLTFAAAALGVQAIYWLVLRSRQMQQSINRRLLLSKQLSERSKVLDALRTERGFADFRNPTLRKLSDWLMQTGMRFDQNLFLLSCVGLSVLFFFAFGFLLGYGAIALVSAIAASALSLVLFFKTTRSRRIARFTEQLPDALDVIVRGVRVGYPFSAALGLVAQEMKDPIGSELGMTADEIAFGLDIKTAMQNLYRRVGQEDLLFLVVSVNVQTQTGGNLAEILSRLSRLVRNRGKVRLKIRAITAEGRMSAMVLTLMPFILFGIINLIAPVYYGAVHGHPLLPAAVTLGVVLLVLGNIMIYRMVNFKY